VETEPLKSALIVPSGQLPGDTPVVAPVVSRFRIVVELVMPVDESERPHS
jgi:hypothetical protein